MFPRAPLWLSTGLVLIRTACWAEVNATVETELERDVITAVFVTGTNAGARLS